MSEDDEAATLQMSQDALQSSQNAVSSQHTSTITPTKTTSIAETAQFGSEDLMILYRAKSSGMSFKNLGECRVIASILNTTPPCAYSTRVDMVVAWLKQNSRVEPKNLLTMSRDLMNYQPRDNHENGTISLDSMVVTTTKKYNGFTSFSKWYNKKHMERDHYETYLRNIGCTELAGPQVYNKVCSQEWKQLSKVEGEGCENDPSNQAYWRAKAIAELASRSEEQKLEDYAYSLKRI